MHLRHFIHKPSGISLFCEVEAFIFIVEYFDFANNDIFHSPFIKLCLPDNQ